MNAKEISYRVVCEIAAQYSYKADSIAFAKELLAKTPQLWAYDATLQSLKSDGFKITENRKALVWAACGGK